MAKLYTGCGDEGCTDTLKEKNVPKNDPIITLLGELDEFSSCLGVAKAHTKSPGLIGDIELIQNRLISVMGEISGGKQLPDNISDEIENLIDGYQTEFTGFAIAGKNTVSAFLDLARCIIRRAERTAAGLLFEQRICKKTYIWLNRVSDLIYAMSRKAE